MPQAMVNFRMDENTKKNMEQVCKEMGLTMTTAFTIFATKVAKEKRIPFEICADPFYSEKNIEFLKGSIAEMEQGKVIVKSMSELEDMASE